MPRLTARHLSPWQNGAYDAMARKTVLKQALKYAPLKTDLQKALSTDETIKTSLSVDMSEVTNELVLDAS